VGSAYPSGEGRLTYRRRVGLVSTGASNSVCSGARDGAMARFEVITGPERRRRWSAEQKRTIVSESLAPGAVVTEIARRADPGGVGGGRGQSVIGVMIPVPSEVRVWLAVGHTDMRRGMNSLALQVQEGLKRAIRMPAISMFSAANAVT
jgi:hypothetical protein